MSSSGSSKTQTQNQLSPDSLARYNQYATPALSDATQPFQAYTGELAPGTTAGQQQATTMANNNLGLGSGAVSQGVNTASGVAGYSPNQVKAGMLSGTDLSSYLNPYTSDVINTTNQQIDQQRQRDINSNSANSVAAGAFGGSRQGVADAQTNQYYGQLAANTDANLNAQNYTNAQQAALSDIGNNLAAQTANQNAGLAGQSLNLQGAGMLGSLGQTQQNMGLNDTSLIDQLGTQAQQTKAAQDAANYGYYQYGQQFPLTQAGILAGLMGATPYTNNSNQTVKTSSFDPLGWFKAMGSNASSAAGAGG